MNSPRLWPLAVLLLVVFALLSSACGSVAKVREAAARQQKQNDLMQIGLSYLSFCDQNRKGPVSADELLTFEPSLMAPLQKVKSGEYVIIWGVNLTDSKQFEPQGKSATILGYESAAPNAGGAVLMADSFAKPMTAAEFKAAAQAKSGGGKGK